MKKEEIIDEPHEIEKEKLNYFLKYGKHPDNAYMEGIGDGG